MANLLVVAGQTNRHCRDYPTAAIAVCFFALPPVAFRQAGITSKALTVVLDATGLSGERSVQHRRRALSEIFEGLSRSNVGAAANQPVNSAGRPRLPNSFFPTTFI